MMHTLIDGQFSENLVCGLNHCLFSSFSFPSQLFFFVMFPHQFQDFFKAIHWVELAKMWLVVPKCFSTMNTLYVVPSDDSFFPNPGKFQGWLSWKYPLLHIVMEHYYVSQYILYIYIYVNKHKSRNVFFSIAMLRWPGRSVFFAREKLIQCPVVDDDGRQQGAVTDPWFSWYSKWDT